MASYCGCFYRRQNIYTNYDTAYLPQVELNVHATILSSTSRTVLTQTFVNPSTLDPIEEVLYAFPLYDGVSVVGFTCHVGERILQGEVKAKEQANRAYQEAVSLGQTAGILDSSREASDAFLIRLGNVPAHGKVVVEITFIGELKQDAQAHGIRYTIPSVIAPRYGQQRDETMATTPQAPATETKKTPATGKAKQAGSDVGEDTGAATKEPEKEVDPQDAKAKKEKEVLFIRHKLQKGFLSRDQPPKEEEMTVMSTYLSRLEAYEDIEVSILRSTKINKVLRMIVKLSPIPCDEEFNFRGRAINIMSKWKTVLDSDPAARWSSKAIRGGVSITVDVAVEKGSVIRNVQSPSHPIKVSLGRTSLLPESVFETHQASASLYLSTGNAHLDRDFVMMVTADGQDIPCAFLETHPAIPEQKALMVSLVPKFDLPRNSPEIVFIIDRSGSMHSKIPTLKSALKVFLKSLPVGVHFNICSFGTYHKFLWPRSKLYNENSLNEAVAFTDGISADMGGTEMQAPVEAVVKNRFQDLDLEVLLLTDGQIWNQETLFTFVKEASSKDPVRFFTLGIGDAASHSLIEGIARGGNGFSQSVIEYEELDKKVVRMLKGALMPHVGNYKLEVEYAENDQDFEMIDPVQELSSPSQPLPTEMDVMTDLRKPILLYDSAYKEPNVGIEEVQGSLATDPSEELLKLSAPDVLQVPSEIPPLYPFIRSTAYILFTADASKRAPKSLTLRASSSHGPLTLQIPIRDIDRGQTFHQLAARKAALELEEGRGWVFESRDGKGDLIKHKFDSKMEDVVARECQRLGTQFQVTGKFCSFVALEKQNPQSQTQIGQDDVEPKTFSVDQVKARDFFGATSQGHAYRCSSSVLYAAEPHTATASSGRGGGAIYKRGAFGGRGGASSRGYVAPRMQMMQVMQSQNCAAPMPTACRQMQSARVPPLEMSKGNDQTPLGMGNVKDKIHRLISLQSSEGSWFWNIDIFAMTGLDSLQVRRDMSHIIRDFAEDQEKTLYSERIIMTMLVIMYLEKKAPEHRGTWELVEEKAERWVEAQLEGMSDDDKETLESQRRDVMVTWF